MVNSMEFNYWFKPIKIELVYQASSYATTSNIEMLRINMIGI